MPDHYRYSPSSSSRWLMCPGSVKGDIPEDVSSSYAEEGTLAHEYAAAKLLGTEAPEVTEEMSGHVRTYLDYIESLKRDNSVLDEQVEVQLVSEDLQEYGGTIDHKLIYKDTNGKTWLHVTDLKYGVGIVVPAKGATQLLCYLMLASAAHPHIKHFRATIVQPRTPGEAVDTIDITVAELEVFEAQVRAAMQETYLHAGDHCRYCPKKLVFNEKENKLVPCEALHDEVIEATNLAFAEPVPVEEIGSLVEPSDLMVGRWCELYEKTSAIKAFLDEIPKWMLAEMKRGRSIPGYKAIVARGHRRWRDEEEVMRKLSRKLGKRNITLQKLMSPAQIEKAHPVHRDMIAKFIERPDLGPKVVPESRAGDRIEFSSPEEAFTFDLEKFLEG